MNLKDLKEFSEYVKKLDKYLDQLINKEETGSKEEVVFHSNIHGWQRGTHF